MDFINWKKEVKYWLSNDYRIANSPTLIENYKFYRSGISPREAATYLSNIIYYRDLGF